MAREKMMLVLQYSSRSTYDDLTAIAGGSGLQSARTDVSGV